MIITESTAAISEFTRWYLALFYTAVAAFYTLRIVLVNKTTQQEHVFPGAKFCSTWWNHMVFRVFRIAIWMVCVFRLIWPSVDNYLGMLAAMQTLPVILLGNILLTAGFCFAVFSHYSMGNEWRSGIDPQGPGSIVTTSVYKFSRNPMFLGVATAQVGFFLALPSVFSLVCLMVGLYTLHSQVKSEEQHLSETFPEEYQRYRANVRRWI